MNSLWTLRYSDMHFFTFDLNVHVVTLNLMFLADIVWVITQQPLMKDGSYLVCDTIMTNHVVV